MSNSTVLMFIADMITGLNVVLVFGAAFLVLEIVISLGKKGGYILATGWRFFLPAIAVLAALRIYDFFLHYTPALALLREIMNMVFTVLLFVGVLLQYLAIRKVIEKRM
jgi:hypothetical protein